MISLVCYVFYTDFFNLLGGVEQVKKLFRRQARQNDTANDLVDSGQDHVACDKELIRA